MTKSTTMPLAQALEAVKAAGFDIDGGLGSIDWRMYVGSESRVTFAAWPAEHPHVLNNLFMFEMNRDGTVSRSSLDHAIAIGVEAAKELGARVVK